MAKFARNAEYTKDYNRKMFLRLLRAQPLSRSEIARRMGLSRAAASLIADELMALGLVREVTPGGKPLGRNPVPLCLVAQGAYAIGVFLNREGCRVGIVDFCGNVLAQRRLTDITPERIPSLAGAIRDMAAAHGIPEGKLVGVGVSAPGPLDGEKGRILNPPGFESWHRTDVVQLLQAQLRIPVYLANDASCLAQYSMGKPETRGSENYLLLLVDRGIGSGVVLRGKVLKGAGFFTGELGHTSIAFDGRKCGCGNQGCLEAYASVPNLLRGSSFSSWQQVMDSQNLPEAQELLRREVGYLTAGIVNLANLVSIDTVLLAGDLLYRGEETAALLEAEINPRLLRRESVPICVHSACSGPDVPIVAAAELAFGWFLRSN